MTADCIFMRRGGKKPVFVEYNAEHTITQVTGSDGNIYNLYTLKKSGTLTVSGNVKVWCCGGGGSGGAWRSHPIAGGAYNIGSGGGGGYVSGEVSISDGSYIVTIASGGQSSSSGSGYSGGTTSIKINSTNVCSANGGGAGGGNGGNGGSGGGGGAHVYNAYSKTACKGGTGAGISTYPFGITNLKAHSAGGGGSEYRASYDDGDGGYDTLYIRGGRGGSNGGNGSNGTLSQNQSNTYTSSSAAAGGSYGGGKGAANGGNGGNATFYGGGGGGTRSSTSGSGYQGVAYILIPA